MEFNPTDTVVLGVIGFIQVMTLALVGVLSKRTGNIREDTRETKEQVVNDHGSINFRDENDRRHAETRRWFMQLSRHNIKVDKRLDEQDDMLVYLATGYKENREDIDDLQDTLNPLAKDKS